MSLVAAILDELDADALGELLRELTFPGDGFGCYSTFDVRRGAVRWSSDSRERLWIDLDYEDVRECRDLGDGYTWMLGKLRVDVCWFWDGDGTLVFRASARGRRRLLINTDCKKDYGWSGGGEG